MDYKKKSLEVLDHAFNLFKDFILLPYVQLCLIILFVLYSLKTGHSDGSGKY